MLNNITEITEYEGKILVFNQNEIIVSLTLIYSYLSHHNIKFFKVNFSVKLINIMPITCRISIVCV